MCGKIGRRVDLLDGIRKNIPLDVLIPRRFRIDQNIGGRRFDFEISVGHHVPE
jgi:hypothetical protein